MNKTRGWVGLRTAVVALGLLAGGASLSEASVLMNYSTSGSIDSTGVTGAPVISFNSILNNAFGAPSSFSLGDFQVAALPDGQTTSYANTPFHITYLVNTVNGAAPSPNQTPIQISGMLNGQIGGTNQSSVVAKFDPISNPNFQTGTYANTLSITDNPLHLVPSTANHGQTTAQAYLDTTAAAPPPLGTPEPTSVALFLAALGGLGLKRIRGRKPIA